MGESLEWFLDSFTLKRADLKEIKSDCLSKGQAVLWSYLGSVLEINFIGNDYTGEVLSIVLLLHTLVPLSKEVEGVWVGNIVNQHN